MKWNNGRLFFLLGLLNVVAGEILFHRARTHRPVLHFLSSGPPSWLWGAGALLLGWLLLLRFGPRCAAFTRDNERKWPVWPGLLLVLAVTAALRVYHISTVPAGLWLDETDIAKQALEIVQGARPHPWDVARLEIPWLYHYYVAAFYALLGPGYLTVKLPHLLVSILTGGMVYLLAREIMEEPYALIGGLIWATMRWSMNMSRWGHANTLAVFWYVTVFWLLWRGLRTYHWGYWVAGGIALGLSQYTYQSARALVPLTLLFLLYVKFGPRGKEDALAPPPTVGRRFWLYVGVFYLLFLILYAPLANTYLHHPKLFLERSRAISIFNPLFTRDPWRALQGNVGKYLGMFFYVGDPNGRHNIPGWPVVDVVTALLLVAGWAHVLRTLRHPTHVLLVLWPASFLLAGVLTTEAPNTFRVYGMTPALALLAALGMRDLFAVIRPSFNHAWAPVALFLLIGYLNAHTFFSVQASHPAVVGMFNVGPTRVGQYIASLPARATIYLDREFWAFSPVEVINPGRPLVRLKTPDHVPPPPEVTGPVVYVLGRYGQLLVPYLRRLYPEARVEVGYGPTGTPLYTGVRVPASAVRRRGLRGPNGVVFPDETTGKVSLDGGLLVPQPGAYAFRVEGVKEVRWAFARQLALTRGHVPITLTLPGGLVPVHLELPGEGTPRILWRPPDAKQWEPIPHALWYPLDVPAGGLLAQWFEGGGLRSRPVRVTHAAIQYADNAGNLATAAMRWTGYIYIERPGKYTFGLSSDDGSRLWLDDRLVVDNWGLHSAGWVEEDVDLTKGWHPIRIDYIDNGGSYWFEWRWTPPGGQPGPVPSEVLAWDSEQVRTALQPPPEPEPGLIVIDAQGKEIGRVPVAAVHLQDPRFNRPIADANFQKWPMKLGRRMYDRGIGVYGPGEITFHLGGRYKLLTGLVGVDLDTYGDSHAQVQIIGDGRVLWDSGEIHPWDPPKTFQVNVEGVDVLTFKHIEAGHFEGRGDAIDWVEVKVQRDE